MTKIFTCGCINDQQDKIHGANRRVCNSMKTDPVTYRCTVCGKEHGRGLADKPKGKK